MNIEAKMIAADKASVSQEERDVEAVKAVMLRYAWSLDTKDWERLETCFTDDIVFEASDMGRHVGARNLIEKFQTRVVRVPVRRHAIYNPYVRVEGDTAEFTSYLFNTRMRPRAPGGEFFMAGGYYRNSFVRTVEGWKMSALKWHGFFAEGNPRLDPSLAPTPYVPVMQGPRDAPWGGAGVWGKQRSVSDMLQIGDLMSGLVRAGDARAQEDVAAAFLRDGVADLKGEGAVAGPEAIAKSFCPREGPGWTMHVLSNEKISIVADEARYGAYLYRVSSEDGKDTRHAGGVMFAKLSRTEGGWRIADCTIHFLWERGKPLFEDPLVQRPDIAEFAKQLWAAEDRRQKGSVEAEVRALLWKYTWSFDLNIPDQNRECFAEDVDVAITLEQTVRHFGRHDWLTANLASRNRQMVTLHYVANVEVAPAYNPDLADLKAYVLTRRTAPGEPGPVMIAGGHYFATAKRIDGEWKFVTFAFQRMHGAYA